MKKVILSENVMISAVKKRSGSKRMLDFYLNVPRQEKIYIFSRKYSNGTYEMCKSGIRVNTLSSARSRNPSVMNLVKYLNRMLPYLQEYYELDVKKTA